MSFIIIQKNNSLNMAVELVSNGKVESTEPRGLAAIFEMSQGINLNTCMQIKFTGESYNLQRS